MSKIDEVRSAMMAAMKAKDKERKDALSALLTALKNKAIDKRADLTEEEETQVILKEIKQLNKTQCARIFSQNATAVSQSSKNTLQR